MTQPRTDEADSTDDRTRGVNVLVENHRAFLRFLERRVGDRALAEDLRQDAFTRVDDIQRRCPALPCSRGVAEAI
jgi:RNA polymerase sigma-70 factor (ECF subfamily)